MLRLDKVQKHYYRGRPGKILPAYDGREYFTGDHLNRKIGSLYIRRSV